MSHLHDNLTDFSRRNWDHLPALDLDRSTLERIDTGCLVRIANALEDRAGAHAALNETIETLKAEHLRLVTENDRQKNRIAGYKATITKLKAKLAAQ